MELQKKFVHGGGGGGEGGRWGEGEGGGGGGGEFWCSPSHGQPKSVGGGETSPPDLGAHLWVHTEGPPPPHDGPFAGWGSVGRGLEVGNRGNPNRNL